MLSSVRLFSGNRYRLAADRHQGMMEFSHDVAHPRVMECRPEGAKISSFRQ